MSKEEAKSPKPVVFILLPQVNRPLFKGRVFVSQTHAVVESGQQIKGEAVDFLTPDGFGIYQWRDDDPGHGQRMNAMKAFMAKKNKSAKFIIGPFECREKALKEMDKQRDKAPAEENAILKGESVEKDAEIARLKAKIAETQKVSDK